MRQIFLLALTILALLTVCADAAELDRIVPAKGIGELTLGMSKAKVMDALPYHHGSKQHTFGIEEVMFLYKSAFDGRDSIVSVLFLNNKVIQIATSDGGQKIEGGYSTSTPMSQVKAKFSGLKATTYYFKEKDIDRYAKYRFYDSVDMGVAFAAVDLGERGREWVGTSESLDFIIVHSVGRPAIAIWNKVRGSKVAPTKRNRAH